MFKSTFFIAILFFVTLLIFVIAINTYLVVVQLRYTQPKEIIKTVFVTPVVKPTIEVASVSSVPSPVKRVVIPVKTVSVTP